MNNSGYIYKIGKNDNKEYFLYPYDHKFVMPPVIFGNIKKYGIHIWNDYVINKKTTGGIFTGHKGSGKSLLAEYIANIGIDNGLMVVVIKDIQTDIELVNFIGNLSNVILIFDEFSKNFSYDLQEKMLTMFSDSKNSKRIYIVTENKTNTINTYIMDRPGRVKYHIDFDRLDEKTFVEYCEYHKVKDVFFKELYDLYNISMVFSIDHLKAIISEHLVYPDKNLEETISILNVGVLKKPKIYRVISVKKLDEPTVELKFSCDDIDISSFESSKYPTWIDVYHDTGRVGVKVVKSDVKEIDDKHIICHNNDGYEIILYKTR